MFDHAKHVLCVHVLCAFHTFATGVHPKPVTHSQTEAAQLRAVHSSRFTLAC